MSIHGKIESSEIGCVFLLGSELENVERSRLGVSSSVIGSVFDSMLSNVLESIMGACMEAYSQAGC